MKVFALLFGPMLILAAANAYGQSQDRSLVMPVLQQAVQDVEQGRQAQDPTIRKVEDLLRSRNLRAETLHGLRDKLAAHFASNYVLPPDDEADRAIKRAYKNGAAGVVATPAVDVPKVAMQGVRFDVVQKKSIFVKDDIYVYYFITDGVIPTAKVTGIYKNVGNGQSFFFSDTDRVLFPLGGVASAVPTNQLIIDYGVIESNRDDITEMQKLSGVIIDIAAIVYAAANPEQATVVIQLRKEVKALANELIALKSDDRMFTDTLIYKTADLSTLLADDTIFNVSRTFSGLDGWLKKHWEYRINFRLLRGE